MNLLDFFEPIKYDTNNQGVLKYSDTLVSQIKLAQDGFDLEHCEVAIIGVPDSVNSPSNLGCEKAPNVIRKNFSSLVKTTRSINIVDLGNIKGATVNDRYFAIQEVAKELFKHNVTILFLGGGQDYIVPFSKSLIEPVNLSIIDNKVDYSFDESCFSSETSISQLAALLPSSSLNVNIIGGQNYFIGESQTKLFAERNWNISRLKDVSAEVISNAEPILRDSNIICLDASSIIGNIVPYWNLSNVNGFSGVDACKLFWYAGMSSNAKVCGLTEYNPDIDDTGMGSILFSQLAWHFLEGMSHNTREVPSEESKEYKIFVVHLQDFDVDVRFYKSRLSDRWWIEVPNGSEKRVIACNKSDYLMACEGGLPQKWWSCFENGIA